MNDSFHIIIPARMSSKRLPGKPLKLIQGIPMLLRVAQTCLEVVGKNNLTVSTPDNEIFNLCADNDIPVVISSFECVSGTDRICEFAKENIFSRYVNVQGDEPLLTAKVLRKFLNESSKFTHTVVGVSPIYEQEIIRSKNVVKVAISEDSLIYASRSPLPHFTNSGEIKFFKHTGLYSFSRKNIFEFNKYSCGTLETAENIEILRLLEKGITVKSVLVENYGRAVDTELDLEYVESNGKF